MRIGIVWISKEPALRAQRIAGAVSNHAKIPLLPRESGETLYHGLEDGNVLEFSADSLAALVVGYNETPVMAYVHVQLIQYHLQQTYSITSELYIDDMNAIQYAAAEERRADGYKKMIESAIEQIRHTRSWIKHRTLQDIRRHLEQAIGIS